MVGVFLSEARHFPDTSKAICVAHHVGPQQLPQAVDELLRNLFTS